MKWPSTMIFIFAIKLRGPFLQTPGRGGTNLVLKIKMNIFLVLIYKTTPKNTWGSSLFQMLRKIGEFVPPTKEDKKTCASDLMC